MQRIDADTFTLILLRQFCTRVYKFKRADAYLISQLERLVFHWRQIIIDVDTVCTLIVDDAIASLYLHQACMIVGNHRVI